MRCILVIVVVACLGLGSGCGKKTEVAASKPPPPPPPKPEMLARFHFIGSAQLATNTNASKFKMILDLPATLPLRQQVLQKLAHASERIFNQQTNSLSPDRSELFRPLLEDLLRNETFAEARGITNRPADWTLAVHLSEEQTQVWRTNLWQAMQAWNAGTPTGIQLEGFAGWEAKKTAPQNSFRFVRAGEWVVIGSGPDNLPLLNETLVRIKTTGRPTAAAQEHWLKLEANLPRLAARFSLPAHIAWPQTQLFLSGRGENLSTKMDLVFAEPMSWPLPPWQVPTNIIHDPLNSFTAVRGLTPWLKQSKMFQQLELNPPPDQFYAWAQMDENMPVLSYIAMPFNNASNTLDRIAARLPAVIATNFANRGVGEIRWATNHTELIWQGLLIVTPFLRPMAQPNGDILLGGLFPPLPSPDPLPPELLAQLMGRTNLLYYDWEITQKRFIQWRGLSGLFAHIATGRVFPSTNSAAHQWLLDIQTNLVNTVTEGTANNPRELTLVRTSQIGFSGIELLALANWLDDPDFPFSYPSLFIRSESNPGNPPRLP